MNQQVNPTTRLERLEPLLRSEPDNLPLHRECVELAMSGGEFGRALSLVDARLTRHPSEAETLFARSNALIGLKQYADAIAILKTLEEQGVAQLAVLRNLATCHYFLRQFQNVRAYTERLLAAGETSAATLHLAISSLHHLGEMDEAVKLADEHAATAEENGALAGTCAMVYVDVAQTKKAAKFSIIALRHNPDSIDGLTVQATLAAAALETDQALHQYARVTELAPNNGRAWLGLGLLATLAQDFAKARELTTRATELMPDHVGSWHALAWAHLFGGDHDGAERNFAHALELDRNFGESHGAMAAMLAMKGDRAGAEREIEIAERLDRNGMSAHFARAMLIANASGKEASREFILETVRTMAPKIGGKASILLQNIAGPKGPRPS